MSFKNTGKEISLSLKKKKNEIHFFVVEMIDAYVSVYANAPKPVDIRVCFI